MNAARHPQPTLRIANTIGEMAQVVAFVERFGAEHALPASIVNDLNLCLDELLNNTISYGYGDKARHHISINLRLDGATVVAELEDDARPFDPRLAAPPRLSGDLQMRAKGGLGLHFVNSLMDEVDYRRSGRYNCTILKKMLQPRAGEA